MSAEGESRESLEAEWDLRARASAQWDHRSRGSTTTWVPPIMGSLVDAARLPVSIALLPGGSYSVAYKHDPNKVLLETASADEAVATAVAALQEYLQA